MSGLCQYAVCITRNTTDPQIKALRQSRHRVRGLVNRRAIKEKTIAINRDWVSNQACRLSHNIHFISNLYIAFDNLFELIAKIWFPYNSFEFINEVTIKYRF